jgi:peptidoglycan/LPS O-acetylase OafA/YrhL
MLLHRESRVLELLLVQHGCFFSLGVVLWSRLLKRDTWAGRVVSSLLLLPCLLQIAAQHALAAEKTGLATPLWPPLLAWLGAVAWMALSIRCNARLGIGERWRRLLRRIGLMTYPLYLIHQVIGCMLLGVLASAGVNRFAALILAIALLLALSNLICSLLEPPLRATLRQGFALVHRHAYN